MIDLRATWLTNTDEKNSKTIEASTGLEKKIKDKI